MNRGNYRMNQREIEKENAILMKKLMQIDKRKSAMTNNKVQTKKPNQINFKQQKIDQENFKLGQRILNSKGFLDHDQQKKDLNEYLQRREQIRKA